MRDPLQDQVEQVPIEILVIQYSLKNQPMLIAGRTKHHLYIPIDLEDTI